MNHRTAPVEIRERLYIVCSDEKETFRRLKDTPTLKEALYLVTCNRVEVMANVEDGKVALETLKDFIFSHVNLNREEMEKCLYTYHGDDAVRHLFRVASSIDSMVMGEPQILGQVKDAYRRCVENKASGIIFNRLLHHAFRVAKRVRTETGIASNAVSISFTAVQLAKKIFGDLKGKSILLIGAGEMAELAARHLINNGVGKIIFLNRTHERAVKLAQEFHGTAYDIDLLGEKLQEVDIVISSTGSPGYMISSDMIATALRRRKNRLMFLIDIAVPRDIDPDAGKIDNAYLYNIDNLQDIVDENVNERIKHAEKAELIIREEVTNFFRWLNSLEVVPTIVALRSKIDTIIEGEMTKANSWMKGLEKEKRENVGVLVSSIVNKILHDPIVGLKEEGENGGADPYVAAVGKLFKLKEED
ncbi:MAG: glutamyl-tRNA reductase [Deltaproteobacteria bacterium]|nr:glutamyl-tRNA reductase [Deltaproteobacteria bacterium]